MLSPRLLRSFSTAVKKRFYEKVSIVSSSSGQDSGDSFEICLDRRKFRTPKNAVLQIPSESLALAVAQEWDSQKETLDIGNMRLTGLCITATDNPMDNTKEKLCQQIMEYIETDTVFYMSNEPETLRKLQELHWGELIRWAKERYDMDIKPTDSILEGPEISPETFEIIKRHLLSYNFWSLIGYQYAVEAVKSVLITMATASCQISIEDAVKMTTLEQRFQTETWGKVEWAHDCEFLELCARFSAGMLFVQLNSNIETVREFNLKNR